MSWLPFSIDRDFYDNLADREREDEYAALYGYEPEGLMHPDVRDRAHDERLAARDRLAERAPHGQMHLAYRERPSDRERHEHFDENRVRALLHPRSGNVQPAPQDCPIDEAA